MGILKALLICAVTVSVCGDPQREKVLGATNQNPVTPRDGRPECALVESLKKTFPNCSGELPHRVPPSYFESRDVLLCFGVQDTHYELCKYNKTLSDIGEGKFEKEGFCGRAKAAFGNYKFDRTNPVVKDWDTNLKNMFSNAEDCTFLCTFKQEIDPICSLIVKALEIYQEVMKNADSAKHEELHSSVLSLVTNHKLAVDTITATKSSSMVEGIKLGVDSPKVALPKEATPTDNRTVRPAERLAGQSKSVQALVDSGTPDAKAAIHEKIDEENDDQQTNQNLENIGIVDDVQYQGHPNGGGMSEAPLGSSEQQSESSRDGGVKSGYDAGIGPAVRSRGLDEDEESNLVTYFILMTGGALLFYAAFHNKNKLLALALEGRRANRRGGRHSSAAYSKLHSNLEEAISAGPTSPSATHVLY